MKGPAATYVAAGPFIIDTKFAWLPKATLVFS